MANNIAGGTNTKWGTDSLGIVTGNGTYAILESISITDPNGKPIFVEGRNGTDAVAVMLDNGFDASMKAVYQTNVNIPTKGELLNIKLPNNTTGNLQVRVSGADIESQKKDLTRVTLSAFYRPDIGA